MAFCLYIYIGKCVSMPIYKNAIEYYLSKLQVSHIKNKVYLNHKNVLKKINYQDKITYENLYKNSEFKRESFKSSPFKL